MDLRSIQGELVVNSNQVQQRKYDSFLRRAKISNSLSRSIEDWGAELEECFNLIDEWVCGGRADTRRLLRLYFVFYFIFCCGYRNLMAALLPAVS